MEKRWSWDLLPAIECFPKKSRDWDAVNKKAGNHILLDSEFVGSLVRHFAGPNVLLAVSQDPEQPGMALVHSQRRGFWEIFTPSQAPLGPIVLGSPDPAGRQVRELMNCLPGFPVQLAILRQDPQWSAWFPLEEGSQLEAIEIMQTARIRLEGTFEEFWKARSSNLRHNLNRQRRRLKEQGRTIELVTHTSAEAIPDCIREFGRLESAGWKAELGTAVNENNVQGRFYRDMFERFCGTGNTVIFQLLLDGKVVATDLCLLREGMLVVLKTAYDESVQSLSPALLMREDILRFIYSDRRYQVVEFYGRVLDWHLKWSSDTRPMYHLNQDRNLVVRKVRDLVRSMR
ncbi:MAG: GNAT family N-acetyltransferase [Actinomycetota bacterium]